MNVTHVNFPSGVIPSRKALAMDNLAAGAGLLGYGFDIFGA